MVRNTTRDKEDILRMKRILPKVLRKRPGRKHGGYVYFYPRQELLSGIVFSGKKVVSPVKGSQQAHSSS